MQKLKKLLFLSISLFILLACEREENSYPKTFAFDNFSTGSVKLHTNLGAVNDSEKTKAFIESFDNHDSHIHIKENKTKSYFEAPYSFFVQSDKIELLSASKAKITIKGITTDYDLIRKNGILYFQSLNTSHTSEIMNNTNILLYHPLEKEENTVAGSTEYAILHTFKPCLYAIETEDVIQFPLLNAIESSWAFHESSKELIGNKKQATFYIQNDINPNYLSLIEKKAYSKDTIAYQRNKVVFRKKN